MIFHPPLSPNPKEASRTDLHILKYRDYTSPHSCTQYYFGTYAMDKYTLSLCHKLWFSNPYIFATQCRRP